MLALLLHNSDFRASELVSTTGAKAVGTIRLEDIAFEVRPIPNDRVPPRQLEKLQDNFGTFIGGSIAVHTSESVTQGSSERLER